MLPTYNFGPLGSPLIFGYVLTSEPNGFFKAELQSGVGTWIGIGNTPDNAVEFLRLAVARKCEPSLVIHWRS